MSDAVARRLEAEVAQTKGAMPSSNLASSLNVRPGMLRWIDSKALAHATTEKQTHEFEFVVDKLAEI